MGLIIDIPNSLFNTLGAGGNSGLCFLEVEVGTPDGDAANLTDGTDTFTDPALINRCVEVHRDNVIQPSILWRDGSYVEKVLQYSFLTFIPAIHTGELIRIKIV